MDIGEDYTSHQMSNEDLLNVAVTLPQKVHEFALGWRSKSHSTFPWSWKHFDTVDCNALSLDENDTVSVWLEL
jgi:hypothetical protein